MAAPMPHGRRHRVSERAQQDAPAQAVKSLETADATKLQSILRSSSLPVLDSSVSSTTEPPNFRADSSGRQLVRVDGAEGGSLRRWTHRFKFGGVSSVERRDLCLKIVLVCRRAGPRTGSDLLQSWPLFGRNFGDHRQAARRRCSVGRGRAIVGSAHITSQWTQRVRGEHVPDRPTMEYFDCLGTGLGTLSSA